MARIQDDVAAAVIPCEPVELLVELRLLDHDHIVFTLVNRGLTVEVTVPNPDPVEAGNVVVVQVDIDRGPEATGVQQDVAVRALAYVELADEVGRGRSDVEPGR